MVEVIMKGIKITIDSPDIIRWPETDFKVCVSICNTAEDRRGIFIKEISIQAGGVILGSTAVGRKLPSISEEYAVAQTLIEKPYYQKMKLWRFLNYSTCSFTFNIDLKAVKPDLCFEDSINLAAIVSVIKEGKEERLNVSREVVYSQSLQKLPGWVAGDPHVHTRFSDALPWCTVKRQALACKKAGFDWVIITDHDDLLDPVAYARERLAIKKELRGKGYGSKAIERLISKYPKIVLEVEKPDTCNARRRISFYERLGFILNLYPYLQPPYNPRMHPVPLFLMSFPHKLNKGEFRQTKDILYERVYHQTHPLDAQGETGCLKDSDSQFTIPHSSS
jgi:GNAT superfamily N-acetyltransferase